MELECCRLSCDDVTMITDKVRRWQWMRGTVVRLQVQVFWATERKRHTLSIVSSKTPRSNYNVVVFIFFIVMYRLDHSIELPNTAGL